MTRSKLLTAIAVPACLLAVSAGTIDAKPATPKPPQHNLSQTKVFAGSHSTDVVVDVVGYTA